MIKLTDRAHGIDGSKYDRSFSPKLATHQLDFGIQRLSYGMKRDELLEELKPGFMELEIRGAYHYLSSGVPWKTQIDFFLDLVGDDYHFVAIDWERYYNNVNLRFAEDLGKSLEYANENFAGRALMYTNRSLYNKWIASRPWATLYELWLAQYWIPPSPNKNPSLPNNREQWSIWQYWHKANSLRYGLTRRFAGDVNVFNGTVEQMREWAGVDKQKPKPEPKPKTLEQRVRELETLAHTH